MTLSFRSRTKEALALYPARTKIESLRNKSASILNCTAPCSSLPFGAINFNLASRDLSSTAPRFTSSGIPITNFPTSASSTFPSKIILFKSAIVATVVPALKLLLAMT